MNIPSDSPTVTPERVLLRLDWQVVRRLDGLLQGDYRTLFYGFGVDFADLLNGRPSRDQNPFCVIGLGAGDDSVELLPRPRPPLYRLSHEHPHRLPPALSGQGPLARTAASAALTKGDYFPGDRLFAIENGPAGLRSGRPQHQPKIKFLMLMRNESLARLRTRFDDATTTLVIERAGARWRAAISRRGKGGSPSRPFSAASCRRNCAGRQRCWRRRTASASPIRRRGFVSLINLASVRELESVVGAPVDPLALSRQHPRRGARRLGRSSTSSARC